jgi:hypothetical protein
MLSSRLSIAVAATGVGIVALAFCSLLETGTIASASAGDAKAVQAAPQPEPKKSLLQSILDEPDVYEPEIGYATVPAYRPFQLEQQVYPAQAYRPGEYGDTFRFPQYAPYKPRPVPLPERD